MRKRSEVWKARWSYCIFIIGEEKKSEKKIWNLKGQNEFIFIINRDENQEALSEWLAPLSTTGIMKSALSCVFFS